MRFNAYVDGFNLYYAIKNLGNQSLKWVDIRRLCECFVPSGDSLGDVYHFTAYLDRVPPGAVLDPNYPKHQARSFSRHKEYESALRAVGVKPVIAHYKWRDAHCTKCRQTYLRPEEKQTDVNIGVHLVKHAAKGEYDVALLVSADSDLVPAVKCVRSDFQRRIRIVAPPGRLGMCSQLYRATGEKWRGEISREQVEARQLPDYVTDAKGRLVATRPGKWR